MSPFYLEFERPIVELENRLEELKILAKEGNLDVEKEIKNLESELAKLKKETFSNLTPWQRVQLARHPDRPYTLDYIKLMTKDFFELHGDGLFRDDPAIVAGIGKIDNKSVVIIGHQKGRTVNERMYRNFGMAHPEGYRKALRVMNLAEKFNKPVICLVDTPGAYPGIGAEERGIAQAIAQNIKEMSTLKTQIVVVITGEGGSGGALGIGVGDVVLMLEYSFYSVISPEGCASIIWRDAKKAPEAAEALKLTPQDLLQLGVIDGIVKEPDGGAHRDYKKAAELLKEAILTQLNHLSSIQLDILIKNRIKKFTSMGIYK